MKNFRNQQFLRSGLNIVGLACVMAAASSARATLLWYNGDYDLNDAYTDQNNVPINIGGTYELEKSLVYDNFVVPVGQQWSVTGVFSRDQLGYYEAPATGVWEIRSGMSAGNGGTVLASGDSSIIAAQLTAADGNNYILPQYQISESVPTLTLGAGTYWMAIAPDSFGYYADQNYIETTSGTNAVGLPQGIDGHSFLNNNLTGPGSQSFVPSGLDFSAGVSGTVTLVPEPATLPVTSIALLGVAWLSWRRYRPVTETTVTLRIVSGQTLSPRFSRIEPLESRQLLSTSIPTAHHHPLHKAAHAPALHTSHKHSFIQYQVLKPIKTPHQGKAKTNTQNVPVPGAYTPVQLENAYGVNSLGAANEGQGITIGIVDEYNDTTISTDAAAFSTEYHLPRFDGANGDPTLTVYQDNALASVGSAAGTGVGVETSLDVEWAHAMAPKANILLVEVPGTGDDANIFVELLHGVQVAAQKGADVVSLSYGDSESNIGATNVIHQDKIYLASNAASGVAVTVSSGDGSTPLFPATSPNVVAVGGTSLYLASVKGKYSFETAWGGLSNAGAGGGGTSGNFPTPTFQSNNGVNFSNRSIPDVSMDADPVTGVSIFDSLDQTADGGVWTSVGGTSLASPLFAGIIALAQQDRVAAGKAPLTSLQINNEIYSIYNSTKYSTYFHDITLGNNNDVEGGVTDVTGHSATVGYDQATGVGSPIASTFVPLLSSL